MIDKLSWIAVYPEIVLLVMACVIAMTDLFVKNPRRTSTYVLTLLSLGVVALLNGLYAQGGQTIYAFGNMVVSDSMGNWLKCFATIAVMVTLVYGRPYAADRDMLRGGELFTLAMFSLLGMFGHDLRQQLPGDLPRAGTAHPVELRPGGAAPGQCHRHRGGNEVFCAGGHGLGFPAIRLVHDVRRHRLAGRERGLQGHCVGSDQAPGSGVRAGLRRRRTGLQAGRGAVPHVDSRRLPGRAHCGDAC